MMNSQTSRVRWEFTLEDPEEFVDQESEGEIALTGDKWKSYVRVHTCSMGQADIGSSGMNRSRRLWTRSRRSSSSVEKRRADLW